MALILRTMKKHMGWEDAKDDYVILDGEKSVGRIYKDTAVQYRYEEMKAQGVRPFSDG
jgi:hypothetical protein